jgi:hypothetical protein
MPQCVRSLALRVLHEARISQLRVASVIKRFPPIFAGILLVACAPRGAMRLSSRVPASSPSTICPFGVRGVRVAAQDTEDGIDVALTAFGCDVVELRERAHGALTGDAAARAHIGVSKPRPLRVANRFEVEDAPGGVVIHVHAVDVREAERARNEVRRRIESAEDEECP